jgi:tol-pal system protein YbgF
MKAMRAYLLKTGTVLIAGAGFWALAATDSFAAQNTQVIDGREILSRLQRLERDLRDVQAETYRRSGGSGPAPVAGPPEPAEADQNAVAVPDLNPLMRRLDDLESSLSRLTGQIEQMGHEVDQLSQKADRLQKQMDYQANPQGNASLPPGGAPSQYGGDAVASLAPNPAEPVLRPYSPPEPGVLGRIPTDTPLPQPSPDPKRDFDAAMNLLSRAQYDQASQAFRSFAEAHPDDDRASAALYWTGDIAYSAKKDYPEAARDFAELLKKYPKAQRAPEGMLKLGLSLFELNQMKEGCSALAALPAKYPGANAAIATRAKNEFRDNKCK